METDPLTLDQAIDFINNCKSNGKKILGVERLFFVEDKYILDPKEIVDFSMIPGMQRDTEKDANSALSFIKSIATENSYFAIVTE